MNPELAEKWQVNHPETCPEVAGIRVLPAENGQATAGNQLTEPADNLLIIGLFLVDKSAGLSESTGCSRRPTCGFSAGFIRVFVRMMGSFLSNIHTEQS